MKSSIQALIFFVILTIISIRVCNAQSYTLADNGKIVATPTSTTATTKTPDKVYQVVDGKTFFQGAKGGVYYYKTSAKTGKQYKVYVSKPK